MSKPDVIGWTGSDDLAGFTGVDTSEYDVPSKWMALYHGDKRIGRIRMEFAGNCTWQVELIGEGAKLSVRDEIEGDENGTA